MPIRVKIEIDTFDAPQAVPPQLANPWFSGKVVIPTYSREEMLGTKLRALLPRDKGRDLYDLAQALEVFKGLDVERIVEIFGRYLDFSGQAISRAQAQERMFAKLANPRFLLDMRPLCRADQVEPLTEESTAESFPRVFPTFVDRLPGEPWGRTPAMKERIGISW